MSEIKFSEIEQKWQQRWEQNQTFKAIENTDREKYYILDMFPYPSGAGLHVGHPLGYIATDIYGRYKLHKGYEVLHPMGFDAFGLPAEQYAIETGQHPAVTTQNNLDRYREQLKGLGLAYDWSREVQTCDPSYYKWTQWIFIQLFNSWYDKDADKAKDIASLIEKFESEGNANVNAAAADTDEFSAQDWKSWSHEEQMRVLLNYRLAYIADAEVNWCPALGTVLANEEVKDGLSERGGYPVEKKKMRQWFLRITAYSERLLNDLDTIDWPDAVKEMQRNWIGRSEGAQLKFYLWEPYVKHTDEQAITVFTTRPDTIYGATFIVIAPEHPYAHCLYRDETESDVKNYIEMAKRRSARDRMSDVKNITGVFTGCYAVHPLMPDKLPIWVADYVLGEYGTGAIMAVPAHDSRDFAFAKHFNLPIRQVIRGKDMEQHAVDEPVECYEEKDGVLINSEVLNGLSVQEAIKKANDLIEYKNLGKRRVNYRLRDANFSRQRYWGEPFPIEYKNDIPYPVSEEELPVTLPEVNSYKPLGTGESPLASNSAWVEKGDGITRETNTMPGWAGSSWYFLRYMDAHNKEEFVSKEKEQYWQNVDFYMGGAEHATGHLLYSRFWHKFLNDRGLVSTHEPFKKMVNQGMILGRSSFVYRGQDGKFYSFNLKDQVKTTPIHVDVSFVKNDVLDIDAFRNWREDFANAEFVLEDGKYICGWEVEKMSKSRYNVVNPDDIISRYGCDTFRMYEMFLGPIEQHKPWNTDGIDGVFRFLRKFLRLYLNDTGELGLTADQPTSDELKILHKTIKKVSDDVEKFSFNTAVSAFMICVNELGQLKCNKREILEPLVVLISPFAPHISEELWEKLGHEGGISRVGYPVHDEQFLKEDTFEYPVSINGKSRAKVALPLDMKQDEAMPQVLALPDVQKWVEDKPVKRFIMVPGRIINIVV